MILLPAIIEGIKTRRDNTIAITLACQELDPNKVGQLMTLHNRVSAVAIKPDSFTKEELKLVESIKTDDAIGKPPSQRLRNTLYRVFEQDNGGYTTFEQFYTHTMETIINHYKSKLL